MPERERYNPYTGQMETYYPEDGEYPDQSQGGTAPGPSGPAWTDPDNAPASWLYDPNAVPPPVSEPGLIWTWGGEKWELRQSPRYQDGTTTTPTTPTGGDVDPGGPNPFNFDGGGFDGNYNWPSFSFPSFSYGEFTPNPFEFKTFTAPTLEEAENEPGYAFAKREGEQGLMANRSAMGTLRSSGTLKDLLKWYNGFAEQNYGNAFNRNLGVFRENEGNRFQAHQANEGNRFQAWGGNRDLAFGTHDRNYKTAWDSFSAENDQRKFELGDAYNRWLAKLNAATSLARPVD